MGELGDIVARARAAREGGQAALLATLVSVRGSSYRRPGARLLIACDAVAAGSVSGGCLERDLVRRGWWRVEGGGPALVTYDSTDDEDGFGPRVGLGCNGVVEILIERLPDEWERTSALGFIQRCLAAETAGTLVTVFRSRDPGLPAGTWVGLSPGAPASGPGAAIDDLAGAARTTALAARSSATVRLRDDAVEALIERVRPPPHLFVFGAGADAVPLIQLARTLGWTTTVWDPSARFESRLRLATADHRFTGPAAGLAAAIDRAVAPVVVVMTHDVERDQQALATALDSRARYVGVLGPRRRTDRLLAAIGAPAAPASLRAPAGLAIGAETAAEIALSIVAEIQSVLAGETALPLRDRTGPIHRPAGPACAILAAGAGRRYGGPKQLADFGGQPLLRRIASAACGSRCGAVGVVLGARAETVWPSVADLPVQRIDNPGWDEGMASSIRAAVDWAQATGAGALLLTVGDQPALDAAHLDAVVGAAADGGRVAASRYAGVLGPPALFPAAWFGRLRSLRGDVGARALLREHAADVVAVDWPAGAADLDLRSTSKPSS
ncbi:MAG TPA: NTP transferase domain-containing protein [Polyangia bacterium]|nr:NTP transferase domain-containing protein [Polyangia bacterium]